MQQLQRDFKDLFTEIDCFDGKCSLQVKLDSKPYKVPPGCAVYTMQKPFKGKLEQLQLQDIITPVGVVETAEWCNSFVLVLKSNVKVRLCLVSEG